MKYVIPLFVLVMLFGCGTDPDLYDIEEDEPTIVTTQTNAVVTETTETCLDDLSKPIIFRVRNILSIPIENMRVAGLDFGYLHANYTSCHLSTDIVKNIGIDEFFVTATIKDKTYKSRNCLSLNLEDGPANIYTYTSGKFIIIVNAHTTP